ncbi:hypothetical protein FACS1894132_11960 [Clostridia bacterium]|nr:hypothetical protein FACS1894132_11960 [Clostridia bacterium]
MKKLIFVFICVILMNIFGSCEKNVEILHEIPTNSNDLILAYFNAEVEIGQTNIEQYLISADGIVAVFDDDYQAKAHGKSLPNIALYSYFNNHIKLPNTKKISIEPLTDIQISMISKINIVDIKRKNRVDNIGPIEPSQKFYLIAQKTNGVHSDEHLQFNTDDFTFEYIYYIGNGTAKNNSPYTDEIIDYIDYAVSEAKKAGL